VSAPYDLLGVGIGPFNLSLAALCDGVPGVNALFLDAKPAFSWHPGLLMEGTVLQVPFLADLVTMADPTSRFSFLNYLKHTGRLYPFYIRESFFPLRREYVDYCRWAAGRLRSVHFGQQVTAVEYADGGYLVHTKDHTYRGRRLVLGTGTPPHVPAACRGLGGDLVHSSGYLDAKPALQAKSSITVVGSGQSAAEIYYDLLRDAPDRGYELVWVTRSARFFPLEYTKLTLEMTSPEYVDYFHALPAATRDRLNVAHKQLYKGINADLINEIFDLLYRKNLHGPCPTRLMTNTELRAARYDGGAYTLGLYQHEQGRAFDHTTQGLVLATGYRYREPAFLTPIAHRLGRDDRGRLAVRRDYRLETDGPPIYVQNAELHTHGFTAPDLGMAAYRNSRIIADLLGREHYPVERSIAFQEFAAPVGHPLEVGTR
jgi:lysine N6-hydroxylase